MEPGGLPWPFSYPYSPECVEGAFYEVCMAPIPYCGRTIWRPTGCRGYSWVMTNEEAVLEELMWNLGEASDAIYGGPGKDLIDCAYLETRADDVGDTAYADSEDTVVDCKDVRDDPTTPQS